MPGLAPIAQVANTAIAAPIAVDAARCVASRHRASTCHACIDACGNAALRFEAGRVVVDDLACDGCLGCVPVCPTEAITVVGQDDQRVSVSADVALENAGGVAVFACHRAMNRADLDLSAIVAVPCLASIDESLLCEQASRGAYRIALVDAGCAECPRAACSAAIDETVACADALLALSVDDLSVERLTAFPEEVLKEPEAGYDASRRFLFTQAGHAVGEQVLKAVDAHVAAKPTEGEASGSAWNPLQTFSIEKRMRLLDALDTMGAPQDGRVETRSFHTLEVAAADCSGCGVCAMFCPTGALRFESSTGVLEWSAAECSGCSLCRDVCGQKAISIKPGVACAELFDFEPRVLRQPAGAKGNAAPDLPSAWSTGRRGSLANRFFAGGRAIDPAIERIRARVVTHN